MKSRDEYRLQMKLRLHLKKTRNIGLCIGTVFILLASMSVVRSDEKQPKYTVQEIMKAVFKGEDSVHKRIINGKGQAGDYDKLIDYLSSLPLNDPPQGDPDAWKKKASDVLAAAEALKENKSDALAHYRQAVDCQACHKIYRPE